MPDGTYKSCSTLNMQTLGFFLYQWIRKTANFTKTEFSSISYEWMNCRTGVGCFSLFSIRIRAMWPELICHHQTTWARVSFTWLPSRHFFENISLGSCVFGAWGTRGWLQLTLWYRNKACGLFCYRTTICMII